MLFFVHLSPSSLAPFLTSLQISVLCTLSGNLPPWAAILGPSTPPGPLSLWCVSGVEPEPGRQPRPSAPSIEQWAGWRTETMTGSREGADVFCGKRYMFMSVRDDITRQDRESCRWLAALLSQGHWHAVDFCCGPVMPMPVTGNPGVTAR